MTLTGNVSLKDIFGIVIFGTLAATNGSELEQIGQAEDARVNCILLTCQTEHTYKACGESCSLRGGCRLKYWRRAPLRPETRPPEKTVIWRCRLSPGWPGKVRLYFWFTFLSLARRLPEACQKTLLFWRRSGGLNEGCLNVVRWLDWSGMKALKGRASSFF